MSGEAVCSWRIETIVVLSGKMSDSHNLWVCEMIYINNILVAKCTRRDRYLCLLDMKKIALVVKESCFMVVIGWVRIVCVVSLLH